VSIDAELSFFILTKESYNTDKPISYAEGEVWPARCNTNGRNAESQLL
jgi:hypothetical protein